MNNKKLNSLITNTNKAKQFLKSEISTRLKTRSYRDLEKITGLNSKQLQRINSDKFPHFESVLKAIQGLLNNANNLSAKKVANEWRRTLSVADAFLGISKPSVNKCNASAKKRRKNMSDKIKIGKYDLSAKPNHIMLLKLGKNLKRQHRYFEEYSKLLEESEMESFNQDFIEPLSLEISLLKWALNCPAGNDDDELYIEYFNRNENA